MSLTSLLRLPVAGAQLGIGIAGLRGARRLGRELTRIGEQEAEQIRREGLARRGAIRVAFAGSRGGTAGGGVDVNVGSPVDAQEQDLMLTIFSAERAKYNFAIRRERVLAEGRADLVAGASTAFSTALPLLQTILDLPLPTRKPDFGSNLLELGFDPAEAPLLTGQRAPLFSLTPDPSLHLD